MLLASLIAQVTSQTVLRSSLSRLQEDKKFAVSYQRISKVFSNISNYFIPFLLNTCKDSLNRLIEKIELFLYELFDPNFRHRNSSLENIKDALNSL